MKSVLKILTSLAFLSVNFMTAQQVVKNDTISGTPLSVTMDKRIDDLMTSMEDKCSRPSTGNTGKNWSDDPDLNSKITNPKINVPDRELTQAEICRRNPRIMGYKIQLAVVKSNEEAREVGMYFRRRFPNMKVEIDASLRPNYKVMAGSYLSRQSAAADLSRIRQFFASAIAIQYRVFCVEAK